MKCRNIIGCVIIGVVIMNSVGCGKVSSYEEIAKKNYMKDTGRF